MPSPSESSSADEASRSLSESYVSFGRNISGASMGYAQTTVLRPKAWAHIGQHALVVQVASVRRSYLEFP